MSTKSAKAKAKDRRPQYVIWLEEARQMDGRAGGQLYDRLALLDKIFHDPEWRAKFPRGTHEMVMVDKLDRELSEAFQPFWPLSKLREYCPDRTRWVKESVQKLY